jgi:hypothetical protein
MSEQYEPLNPEDIGLLVGIAGPVYQESKYIDSMTGQQPQDSRGAITSGTNQLKQGLERIVQTAVRQPPPLPVFSQPEPEFPPYSHIPPDTGPSPYRERADALRSPGVPLMGVPDPQLEFDFNLSEQKKTNDLLEKNNKLLQKIIQLLQSKKLDEPVKLNTQVKGNNSVPNKPV